MKFAALALLGLLTLGQTAHAGRVGGGVCNTTSVNAYSTDVFRVTFQGGQPAKLAIQGDGDTDLDVMVYDENGNLVAADTDPTDRCHVAWHPIWTGQFTIRVINHGDVYNNYVICVD